MKLSKRLLLLLLLLLVAMAATLAYRWFERDKILARRAEVLFAQADYVRAAPLFLAALDLGMEERQVRLPLARSLLLSGQPEKAAIFYERDLAENPDRLTTLLGLGDAYARMGQFPAAVRLYQAALDRDSRDRLVQIKLARALAGSGRFDEAITVYRQALGENP
jgi:tetratricopeptide (TPR) repeat protein